MTCSFYAAVCLSRGPRQAYGCAFTHAYGCAIIMLMLKWENKNGFMCESDMVTRIMMICQRT